MEKNDPASRREQEHPVVEHIGEASRLLKSLRDKLETHPELEQAIEQLEMALSILAVKTGGML
jgi:uncharacterized protein YabN with tetrapyrrole methylase and pyrophosphatase domain